MASNHTLKAACENNTRAGISQMYPMTSMVVRLTDASDAGRILNVENPSDFIVFVHPNAPKPFESPVFFLECKATNNVGPFKFACLQPAQRKALNRAVELQIPYFVLYWIAQNNSVYLIPALLILNTEFNGKKSLNLKELEPYKVPAFNQLWSLNFD